VFKAVLECRDVTTLQMMMMMMMMMMTMIINREIQKGKEGTAQDWYGRYKAVHLAAQKSLQADDVLL
jgi:hypothetical protein